MMGALEACHSQLGSTPIPMVVPVADEQGSVESVVDLLQQKVIRSGPSSPKVEQGAIPDDLATSVADARKQVMEAVAELDEQLLDRYLASGELTGDELLAGLRAGILAQQILPVYGGSATRTVGVWSLLHAIVALLPAPSDRLAVKPVHGMHPETGQDVIRRGTAAEPFSAYVFKTLIDPFVGRLSYCRVLSGSIQADSAALNATRHVREKLGHLYLVLGKKHTAVPSAKAGDIVAIGKLKDTQEGDTLCQEQDPVCYPGLGLPRPVMSFAIDAKSKADIDKVSLGLHKLIEEDPTLEFVRNAETKEMVLSGMGQLHIDLALEKLHRKFGADVILHTPRCRIAKRLRPKLKRRANTKSRRADMANMVTAGWRWCRCRAGRGSSSRIASSAGRFRGILFPRWKKASSRPCMKGS